MKKNSSELTRRDFINLAAWTTSAFTLSGCIASASTPPASTPTPLIDQKPEEPDQIPSALPGGFTKGKEALLQLVLGNLRFSSGSSKSPHQKKERREEIANAQHPIAAILSCSDSRVPPEIIFDQGLGDIFIVRVAGNVAAFSDVIASLEYAIEHLNVPLIMILGHQKCGAVTTALQEVELEGRLGDLMAALKPAVKKAKEMTGDKLENAIRANVSLTIQKLIEESKIINHALEQRKVELYGAYYNLKSGKVDLI